MECAIYRLESALFRYLWKKISTTYCSGFGGKVLLIMLLFFFFFFFPLIKSFKVAYYGLESLFGLFGILIFTYDLFMKMGR